MDADDDPGVGKDEESVTKVPLQMPLTGDANEQPVPPPPPLTESATTIPSATTTAAGADHQNKMTSSGPSFLQLNDTKAGMTGLDKDKINQIIQDASKDSPYYKRQMQRQEQVDLKKADLLHRKSKLTKEQIRCAEAEMDKKAAEWEHQRRDMSRIIVHMDMDMFYAAVEMRDDPQLAQVPLAVGSDKMLSTSNYEARKFGVRAGMAGFIALKLCPKLVIKPVDMQKYIAASRECMSYVTDYDPEYRSSSVDEVYFDLTDYVLSKYNDEAAEDPLMFPISNDMLSYPKAVWDMAADVVNELRNKIKQNTRLTCSAGIAHNKMIAKVCSDLNKPDGQFLLDASDPLVVQDFVEKICVRKIGGIGQVQEQLLKSLGIETCKQLFEARGLIQLLFTPASIEFYLRVSLGVASNVVTENDDSKRKSLGSETTFTKTTNSRILNDHLSELSKSVSEDLKKENLKGRLITLNIKWANFMHNDRSRRLSSATNEERVIRDAVRSLLQQELEKNPGTAIRLLGVRVSHFSDDVSQSQSSSTSSSKSPPAKKSKTKQKSITDFVRKPSTNRSVAEPQPMETVSLSSRLHPDHDFVCVYCLTQFPDESSLEQHLDMKACAGLLLPESELQTDPTALLRCPICDSEFSDLSVLNSHLDECAK